MKFVPVAMYEGMQKRRTRSYGYYMEYGNDKKIENAIEALNCWLEQSQSPTRFLGGEFKVDGVVDQAPRILSDLPKKEDLLQDISRILSEELTAALIFVDLDNFKSVNDTLGHSEGDRCLIAVVETMGKVIVGKGRLYRYGGDEFAVLLRNFVLGEAKATAERIREKIEAANVGGTVQVTASLGVACSDQLKDPRPEKILESADSAVYASKHAGRNRVSLWIPA